jgi:nitroreductase
VSFDVHETDRLLTTTRAVRKRLDFTRPVPREVVLDCLRIATQAPSGGNTQGWRWVVIDDAATRADIAAIYRKRTDPYLNSYGEPAPGAQANMVNSAKYLAEHMHEVPVLVIPCLLNRVSAERPSNEDMAGFYGSIIPAIWSFQLALHSRGLGSAFTTLHLGYEEEAATRLGIPNTVTQAALLPVAYTIGDDFKPAMRRPVEEITYFNAWKRLH